MEPWTGQDARLIRVVCANLFVLVVLLLSGKANAQHAGHKHEPVAESKPYTPRLFQSDMSTMAGMTPDAPMHAPQGWQWMTMGIVRLLYNDPGGDSGDEAGESSNWARANWRRIASRTISLRVRPVRCASRSNCCSSSGSIRIVKAEVFMYDNVTRCPDHRQCVRPSA